MNRVYGRNLMWRLGYVEAELVNSLRRRRLPVQRGGVATSTSGPDWSRVPRPWPSATSPNSKGVLVREQMQSRAVLHEPVHGREDCPAAVGDGPVRTAGRCGAA